MYTLYRIYTYMTAWLGSMPWHNSLTQQPTSMCNFSVVWVSLTELYSPDCTSHAVVLLNWREDKYTVWTPWTVKYRETIGIENLKARVTQSMMDWWTTTLHLAALPCGCIYLVYMDRRKYRMHMFHAYNYGCVCWWHSINPLRTKDVNSRHIIVCR